jgi:metal-responsive CopG/Arc/MetJ family transcriptional regulator
MSVRKAIKVAISLSEELFEAAERERAARRETRSEFFRIAVEELLRRRREREAVERYVRGYQEFPESDEEIAVAWASAAQVLAQEPWE